MNIRNSFLAIALVFATSATLFSQTNFQAGVTLGANQSHLRSDLFSTSSGRTGGVVGASFVVGFGDRFELNQEVVFTQKGASVSAFYVQPEQGVVETAYDYHYNTFEAGLFAGFSPFQAVPFTLQAGGFFGTHFENMDRSQTDVYVGNIESLNGARPAAELTDAFSGVDYGPAFGLSAGKGRMRLNARYYLGVKNLYNNIDFVDKGPKITTNSLRLTLTYFLK